MSRPPYTPWRDRPPRFAVAARPIDPNAWLIPDTEAHVLPERRRTLETREAVFRQSADAVDAAEEAARLIANHVGAPRPAGADALYDVAHAVSDDLVVMTQDQGRWRAGALVLAQPTFFSLDEAFGADIDRLHAPVPGGAALSARITRLFDRLREDVVLERFNWTLQFGAERFTPDAAPLRAAAQRAGAAGAERLHVRVERQTVRRLPQTEAVLFTIRVSIDPASALPAPERAPLVSAWRQAEAAARRYKGWAALDAAAEALFARWSV